MAGLDDRSARERVGKIELLLAELEVMADGHSRDVALGVVQNLLALYGEGLGRIMVVIEQGGDAAQMQALVDDEVVSHLLLLHGLHPISTQERVRQALEGVRPYLESHGGNVELLRVENGIVSLRLAGSCNGCASSAATLKGAIEEAIFEMAPEIERIDADGVAEPGVQPLIFCPDGLRPKAGRAVG